MTDRSIEIARDGAEVVITWAGVEDLRSWQPAGCPVAEGEGRLSLRQSGGATGNFYRFRR